MTRKPPDNGHSTDGQTATATDVVIDAIGEHLCERVRNLRKRKGWTLEQLSSNSGVSRSMLSQIERNRANPTLAVACRIARAFGMSLGALVESPDGQSSIQIIRAGDRTYHYRLDRRCRWRTLSPLHLEKDLEFHELRLRPGGQLRSAAHFEGTREFVFLHRGAVRIMTGNEAQDLQEGDSAYYPADVSHAIENTAPEEATIFMVVAYMHK